ncbi:MAG: PD40 domain-containing protein [Gemmatimonadetes bacterium]|nr:PD40 domain-containing protein [Gemmatimonadota bacterium]
MILKSARLRGALLAAGVWAVGLAAPPVQAQYFGRNKVQYEDFQFDILRTLHFDIYSYPEEREAAVMVGRMAERWYARLSRLLDHELHHRQPIIVYASHPHFEQTNAILGNIGEGTGGVTELFKRRVVLPLAGPLEESDHVLGHELAHAFQFDITGDPGRVSAANLPVAIRLPLWFIEGMAEYLSVGPVDPHTAMWMRDAARGKLPGLTRLDNGRYFPYRWGQSLWAYIAGRWGDDAVGHILKASRRTRDAMAAIQRVVDLPVDSISEGWHSALHAAFDPLIPLTDSAPSTYGVELLSKATGSGGLNVAPALSPDGRKVVFMSERGLFSIDIYLADAETGKVERKLTETALDPHFESLQFINSAGAWSADGTRFAVGAVSGGDPLLSVFDIETGNVVREVSLPGLGEVFNPTWSPDGRYLAFSANVAGFSDLFAYDLATDSLRRLTEDAFADLQPAWSPDGSRIAYVTDRFSADLATLRHGRYEVALLDPVSGTSQRVPAFDRGKAINPQWAPDGQRLYFLSDQSGISNIYRISLATQEITQVTNLYAGVTGITGLSPAFSTAARASRLVFTAYQRGDYQVYRVDDADILAGRGLIAANGNGDPAALPPAVRQQPKVAAMLDNPNFGLPSSEDFTTHDYAPRFSLDYVSQPYLVFGSDRFGTFIGGGASLFWSDMLGGHNLATALQVNGSLHDVSALVGYTNLSHRLNWGFALQQIPYVAGRFVRYLDTTGGQLAVFEQLLRYRQINRDASLLGAYPFNRMQRLEFGVGYQNVTFDAELRTIATSYFTGATLLDVRQELSTLGGMHLGSATAALVYDNALFGWTSPILGQRYRFELTPTVGSLTYASLLADYRRYLMPAKPFTLAGRLMHYGRYGPESSAEDNRLAPLFLGYTGIVRGYDINSFAFGECQPTAASSCPSFDRLPGSKLLVGNLEVRFPPLGLLGLGPNLFGAVPIDLLGFYDAGVAWTARDRGLCDTGQLQVFTGCVVSSAGAGLRLNFLGFAIIEIDRVYPFYRPLKGGHWQFSFTPGF